MPGGRRNAVSRTGPTARSGSSNVSLVNTNGRSNSGERANANGADDKRLEEIYSGKSLAPKHIPIPAVPIDGLLSFEVLTWIVSIIATCLQLLNLYRTVWWLPNSYNSYSMNFYLIDPYVVLFIFTLITQRFLFALLQEIIDISSVRSANILIYIRSSLSFATKSVLCWCLVHMIEKHKYMKIFYLCYPSMSVYFVMIRTTPLFACSFLSERLNVLDKPLHNCSLNASAIRAEVSTLRIDFNRRLKHVLVSSSGSAYVCVVAPIIFVPPHLHFNVLWVVQHVILFWLGRLCAYFAQTYPFRYCDELHRAAMHLGRWVKIDNRNNHLYAEPWNEAVLWPHGSIVRHNREIYRSEGLCTAAEPGNLSHYRFYGLFNNRITLLGPILVLLLLMVNIQLFILFGVTEWYQVVSTTLLLVVHYYTLFKMGRDFLVTWKVFRAEQIIQEKSQTVVNPVAQ